MEENTELKAWITTVIQNYSHILSHGITQSGIRLVKGYSEEAESIISKIQEIEQEKEV